VYAFSDQGLDLSGLRSPDDQSLYAYRFPSAGRAPPWTSRSAALPFSIVRRPVTLQVSWRRLYRLENVLGGQFDRYPAGEVGNVQASTAFEDRLDGSIDVISVAGAVKLTSRAAIGVGVDFWSGGWNEHVSYVAAPMPPGPSPFLDTRARTRLSGHNLNVGLLLNYPAWNAGFVFHAPFWSDFSNHVDQQSSAGPPQTADAPRGPPPLSTLRRGGAGLAPGLPVDGGHLRDPRPGGRTSSSTTFPARPDPSTSSTAFRPSSPRPRTRSRSTWARSASWSPTARWCRCAWASVTSRRGPWTW
jgi:hypothetical protein